MKTKQQRTANKRSYNHSDFDALVALIDATDFKNHPYRGILARLAPKLGYKTRSGLYLAIHTYRKPDAVMRVATEIKRIDRVLREAACNS